MLTPIKDLPEVLVLENFITPSYFKAIYKFAKDTSYAYLSNTSYADEHAQFYNSMPKKNVFDVGQFSHTLLDSANNYIEDKFSFFEPFMFQLYDQLPNINFKGVYRAKFNILCERPDYPKKAYNLPHVDTVYTNAYSALLYLHDADGDTVFFKERYQETPPEKFTEAGRIKPKENTVIFFPSNVFHASSNPRFGGNRYVLNVVFDAEPR